MKFRKKPVVIEAIQWDGTLRGYEQIKVAFPDLQDASITKYAPANQAYSWRIMTLKGSHDVNENDWIIRGIEDEYYPCKPDIFVLAYESTSQPEGREVTA